MSVQGVSGGSQLWQRLPMRNVTAEVNKMFELRDADGSSGISSEEFGLSDDLFSAIDLDENGELSTEELEAELISRSRSDASFAPGILQELDADEDGLISQEESLLTEDVFSELDLDQDGYHSAREMRNAMVDQGRMALAAELYGTVSGLTDADTTTTEETT